MNKIKFITKLLPLLILFFIFATASNAAFAQNESLFDLSTQIRQEKITNNKETQVVSLFPFTTLTIKPGTFNQDVTLYVYPGAWNNIKTALLNEQSPISSYYLIFRLKNGAAVNPSIPLTIESYNNYINTDTFFYPLISANEIDRENQKNWPGHIRVRTELPVKDPGFIVAANIDLKPNDSSLNPTITASAPSVVLSPSPKPSAAGSFIKQNVYLILAFVVVIILILGITFLLLKSSKKPNT